MPVIIDKTIHAHTRLAVWEIQEPESELKNKLILNKKEEKFLFDIKTEKKRLQWLASRCLVRLMVNTSEFIAMHTEESGQPVMTGSNKKVSISHAGSHAAVIMSESQEVGIDIEEISGKVMTIRHKFIGEEEMKWMKEEKSIDKHLLIWSAKESLFKWYAKGNVDFRRHLFLNDFPGSTRGLIKAKIKNESIDKNLVVQYEIFGNCVMTWVIAPSKSPP